MENQCTCLTPDGRCQNEATETVFTESAQDFFKAKQSGPLCTKHARAIIAFAEKRNIINWNFQIN